MFSTNEQHSRGIECQSLVIFLLGNHHNKTKGNKSYILSDSGPSISHLQTLLLLRNILIQVLDQRAGQYKKKISESFPFVKIDGYIVLC